MAAISLYIGTGGSGKSLDMAQHILEWVQLKKRNVIANFPVDVKQLYGKCKRHGRFYYFDNDVISVELLFRYAKKMHKPRLEGQTLLCIDECQFLFDPRDNKRQDRRVWLKFLTQFRKLGFDIILTTPTVSLVDRQILGCVEYIVRHRKVNNAGFIGKLLPFPTFAATSRWNGVQGKEGIVEKRFFMFHKKYSTLYDSYKFFNDAKDGGGKDVKFTAPPPPRIYVPMLPSMPKSAENPAV